MPIFSYKYQKITYLLSALLRTTMTLGSGEDAGGAYSNWMIWLENNALWAGIVLIAAVVGCGLILRRHRKD